jgi:hypothetical protein
MNELRLEELAKTAYNTIAGAIETHSQKDSAIVREEFNNAYLAYTGMDYLLRAHHWHYKNNFPMYMSGRGIKNDNIVCQTSLALGFIQEFTFHNPQLHLETGLLDTRDRAFYMAYKDVMKKKKPSFFDIYKHGMALGLFSRYNEFLESMKPLRKVSEKNLEILIRKMKKQLQIA